jgi:hypothetical protein
MVSSVKQAKVVLSKNFNPENVIFSNKISAMNEGGTVTSCKVSYNFLDGESDNLEEGRFFMQSAKMKVPFGATSGVRFGNPDKWSVQLSFRGEDKKSTISRFRKVIGQLDQRIIDEGISREYEIAGQTFDDDDNEAFRQKTIKKGYFSKLKKGKVGTDYPDTFQVSIPWDKEKQKPRDYVKFYNSDNEEVTWDSLSSGKDKEGNTVKFQGAEVVCLFEVSNIWTSTNGSFGPTIRLSQMKICSYP